MLEHIVQQGECISSIARHYGFHWRRLWDDPANHALKLKRKNPNVLFPDDVLMIPEKGIKEFDRSTDQRHPFRVRGGPVKLRVRLLAAGKAIANEQYMLNIEDNSLHGTTDSTGLLEQVIPFEAEEATLLLGKEMTRILLEVGHLDPLSEITGVQARLNNLGFHCGAVDGVLGPLAKSALINFQEIYSREMTGQPDGPTRDKLKELYGC
jgi:Putative peptidoglycan binding domain/LysM domain